MDKHGGKFIASGSYGEVYSPPIKCEDKSLTKVKRNENNVGKVFLETKHFDEEFNVMSKIPKEFEPFAIFNKYACNINNPSKRDTSDNGLHAQKGMMQIVYPNGGSSLLQLLNEKADTSEVNRIKWCVKIFKAFEPIIKGLEMMKSHKILHNDIKPANIVISSKNGAKLIDWGMAFSYNTIVDKQIMPFFFKATYPYYPIDYRVMTTVMDKRKITKDEILHIMTSNLEFIKKKSKSKTIHDLFASIGINISNEIDIVFEAMLVHKASPHRFYINYIDTFNVYSIGISLLEMLIEFNLLESKNMKIQIIKSFISRMIHVDPRLRMTPKSCVTFFEEIVDNI